MNFSTVVLQGGKTKVVQYFVKPFIFISFGTQPITMRSEDYFRFGTTTDRTIPLMSIQ